MAVANIRVMMGWGCSAEEESIAKDHCQVDNTKGQL